MVEKKEIGEAVNRGPCICHLLGSIVTPPFFPHNDAPFRHNYRHYSRRAFYRRHDNGPISIYTGSAYTVPCAYTHPRTHARTRSTSKFFRIARIPSEILFSRLDFIVCFDTKVSCGHLTTLAPLTSKRTDLIRTSFSSSLRKYWTLELALVSYYSPGQSYLIGPNIELLEHIGIE